MAGCITGNTGEHLDPRSPLKTRICNVASRKTHLCTHTQAQTDTAVCQMLVRTWSFYWHVYISHNTLKAHAYTHTQIPLRESIVVIFLVSSSAGTGLKRHQSVMSALT